VAWIFITGSTDGLGRAAARSLIDDGHQVVLHARSPDRAVAVADLAPRAAGLVVGDLCNGGETKNVAEQVNAIGRMDAVIHNAGIYSEKNRGSTPEGHATTLPSTVSGTTPSLRGSQMGDAVIRAQTLRPLLRSQFEVRGWAQQKNGDANEAPPS
jgi:NAD(P)-dependent dehydrogenase (short-subunit alcohol dehydrogenase family)